MAEAQRPAHRRVSRVILLDQHDHIFLLLTASPLLQTPVVRWITPGGGLEEHESHSEGAIRELYEETGLAVESLHGPVFTLHGESRFYDGHVQTTYSEYFVVRTERFDPDTSNWMENEYVDITGLNWFSRDEISGLAEGYWPPNLLELYDRAITEF